MSKDPLKFSLRSILRSPLACTLLKNPIRIVELLSGKIHLSGQLHVTHLGNFKMNARRVASNPLIRDTNQR